MPCLTPLNSSCKPSNCRTAFTVALQDVIERQCSKFKVTQYFQHDFQQVTFHSSFFLNNIFKKNWNLYYCVHNLERSIKTIASKPTVGPEVLEIAIFFPLEHGVTVKCIKTYLLFCSRLITWERFIHNKALSIITARPNTRTIRPYLTSMDHHWLDS